jgi:competence protein ComFC
MQEDRLLDIAPTRESFLRRLHAHDIVASAVQQVTRTILPEVCAGCGISGSWMCADCDKRLRRVNADSICLRCGSPGRRSTLCRRCRHWPAELASSRSAFVFEGPARDAVLRLKYRNEPARAEWCAEELSELLIGLGWQVDAIVPVPLHESRLRVRGYNQAERIARGIARSSGVPLMTPLRRTRATTSQVGLDSEARLRNVAGAFTSRDRLDGKTVVLIDDVLTTGATLSACAIACVAAGADQVLGLTVTCEM